MATKIEKEILNDLKSNQDLKYLDFSSKLIPNVDKSKFIGVRIPVIRKLAKKYAKHKDIEKYLDVLPHKYIEEYNIHGLIICTFTDYDKTISYINKLLPYVDNWATCDIISPNSFKKNHHLLKKDITKWLKTNDTYSIRFGIEMAMSHFLDDDFDAGLMNKISKIKNDEYYVKMMIAWYFATALAKKWDETLPFIKNNKLETWTHNKTIQKAIESYRITDQQKELLRSLKTKIGNK